MTQQDTSQSEPKPFAWLTIDKVLAVLALPSAATFLHYVGREGHRERLHALGVDPGLFEKSMDALLNAGFHYSTERLLKIVAQMFTWGALAVLAWIVFCAVMTVAFGTGLEKLQTRVERSSNSVKLGLPMKVKVWGTKTLLAAFITSGGYVMISLLAVLLALLMIGASAFGQSAGRAEAARQLKEFRKGCEAALRVPSCIEVRKGDELISKGFIIDSNDKYLALYEVDKQRTRTFERSGLDIIGLLSDGRTATALAAVPRDQE